MAGKKTPQTKTNSASPNNDAAEIKAQVAPAVVPPNPILALSIPDPNAIANASRRVNQTNTAVNRSTLVIPLRSRQPGGVAIVGGPNGI
jgi:hypothetical protein